MKFYVCKHCGNVITKIKDSGVPVVCCGEPMTELIPGEVEASGEKHVPVIAVEGNKVTVAVGSVAHPMVPEHFIEWVVLETKQGVQRKQLTPEQEPKCCFTLCEGDEVVNAYAYCNLHGLWKA